jgi:hypothetical protein
MLFADPARALRGASRPSAPTGGARRRRHRHGGRLFAQASVSADAAGYRQLFDFAQAQVPGRRCWAVEGAGSYGAGLAAFLQARSERVVEVARPKRPRGAAAPRPTRWMPSARRGGARSRLSAGPRRRGDREALRVLLATRHSACTAKVSATNLLKALIIGAPEELRAELRGLMTKRQIDRCARLRDRPARSPGHRMTVRALRSTARRIQLLAAEAAELRAELERLVARGHAVATGAARRRADQRRPGPGQLVARRAAALRGRPCCPGWCQPDPGLLGPGHQASPEPLG